MAHDHVSGHASADDEYLETPAGSTYEHTDAHVGPIAKFIVALVVSAVLIHFGLAGMYQLMISESTKIEGTERRYPLAASQEERLPPTPRLQQFPHNELYQFRLDEDHYLQSYGWENKEAGTVHIPIGDAMRLIVERGLPVGATNASEPAAAPGMMPADSSAGRTLERRRE